MKKILLLTLSVLLTTNIFTIEEAQKDKRSALIKIISGSTAIIASLALLHTLNTNVDMNKITIDSAHFTLDDRILTVTGHFGDTPSFLTNVSLLSLFLGGSVLTSLGILELEKTDQNVLDRVEIQK